jgi:hypothetical protein
MENPISVDADWNVRCELADDGANVSGCNDRIGSTKTRPKKWLIRGRTGFEWQKQSLVECSPLDNILKSTP